MNYSQSITQNRTGGKSVSYLEPMPIGEYFMFWQFVEYSRSDPEINKFKPPTSVPSYYLALPLPTSGLVDNYTIDYDGVEMGVPGRGAFLAGDAAINLFQQNQDGRSALDSLGGLGVIDIAKAALRSATNIDAGVGAAIDRTTGNILNPHLVSVFRGVQLRQFQFSWKFMPESPAQSEALKQTIDTIRYAMHPDKEDELVLQMPFECYPAFYRESAAKYLFPIARSVITQFSVDYAPGGVPAFFEGTHAPVDINLTIGIQEVSYLTKSDFEGYDQRKFAETLSALDFQL
jgi:hypothetical protein